MKLNAYSPVNSYAAAPKTMRFSASSSSKTDATKDSGNDSFTFSMPVPGLDKKMKLQDLAGKLKAVQATPAYKAYATDVQEFQKKSERFHWANPEDEDAAYSALMEKHDAVIQQVQHLNSEADKLK